MSRSRPLAPALLAVLLLAPLATTGAAPLPAACVRADLDEAAARLLHPEAEVVDVREQAGFPTALVLTPLVAPGTRHHLVLAGGAWCDAGSAFNAAWRLDGRAHDPVAMAEAFATLAPAPFFADVTVTSSRASPDGAAVTTHARTNGVVAEWVVLVDGEGVREATWTATGFAVAPFEADIEGLTALPGASWRVARGPGGLLVDATPLEDLLLPTATPALVTRHTLSDGFVIQVNRVGQDATVAGAGYPIGLGPDTGSDTGVAAVDFHRTVTATSIENYEEFLSWGLKKGWKLNEGHVYVDDAITAYCLACVWVNQYFQIHISSQVMLALDALGYSYPADRQRDALSNVIGHEMFHNFQNAYSKPGSGTMGNYYSEGLARMQETLHDYASVSHRPDTLVTATDSNGCNGYYRAGSSNLTTAMAASPANRSYSACRFWMPFYATHGLDGLVDLLETSPTQRTRSNYLELKGLVENVTGAPLEDTLVSFAGAILGGHPLAWGPADGSGPTIDWGPQITRLGVPVLAPGQWMHDVRLADGGMVARELRDGGTVSVRVSVFSPDTEHSIHVVRATATDVVTTTIATGDAVAAPAAGEKVWLVVLRAEPGVTTVALRLDP